MKLLAFDGQTGAAGDVICGGLVAAGADPDALAPVEDALPVSYEFDAVTEQGITATRAHVRHDTSKRSSHAADADDTHEEEDADHAHNSDHAHGTGQTHDADHAHGTAQTHDADHTHSTGQTHDAEGAGPARRYDEVVSIVESMGLPAAVERDALAAFELLGEAEAAVHGTDIEATTFHEVGTDDAIADVVGAAALVADLDPDRVVVTPMAVGGGETTFSHGTYPVPAPAVTEIAARSDLAVVGGPVERELLTPTGAAILGTLAEPVERLPPMTTDATGYGAGVLDLDDRPNVLRVTLGDAVDQYDTPMSDDSEHGSSDDGHGSDGTHDPRDSDGTHDPPDGRHSSSDDGHGSDGSHSSPDGRHDSHGTHDDSTAERLRHDDIAVLETNLDDATPEVLGSLQETLLAAGANDVTILPTTMKKARPGHLVKVICAPDDARRLARRLAEETGTLGVRQSAAGHRWIADRQFETVELTADERSWQLDVKVASDGETVYDVSCEYDDALRVAGESSLSVRGVIRRAERRVWDRIE